MKLSIIIPVYNVAAFLPETLECVLGQTFRDFELLLIDDGSTDESGEICDRYAQKDNRVRVIHQKNMGVSAARNTGVAAATGEYIGFVDSDDITEADMFDVMLQIAQKENADIVQCQHDREYQLNGLPRTQTRETLDGPAFVRRMFTKTGGAYTNEVALWSKIYRRELFAGITFPVGRTYEDEQETYKLCLKAEKIIETQDVLYHYIKRENSIITGVSAKKMLHKQAALLDRLLYLPTQLPDLAQKCAESFLRFSESILCQMYKQGDKQETDQAIDVLVAQKKRLKPYLNKYERLYLPALKRNWARNVILKNDFEPIQNQIRRLKEDKREQIQTKKIIILNHGLHISGVSRALVNLANALVAQGHDVTVKLEINNFTLASELDHKVKRELFLKEWRLLGIRIPGFLRFYNWFLKTLYKIPVRLLYKLVVGQEYDVEIGFNRGAAARIIAASTSQTAKKLVWVHSDYMRCDNALAGFSSLEEAKAAYGKFDRIVCVSPQTEMAFREKFGDYLDIATCDNILDFTRIHQQATEFKPEHTGKVLCAVGRICDAKNYPMLLEAAALLKNKGVEFTLWIVGGGAAMEELAAQKDRLGLDNVVLWGAKENPYPYLASADIYVCSSIYEGLSTTTIEALILGKPCVVTDCTGMRDILGDGEYGLVVPITAEALAEGMEKLLTDDTLRHHYEKMATQRASAYAPERCIAEIEKLFI